MDSHMLHHTMHKYETFYVNIERQETHLTYQLLQQPDSIHRHIHFSGLLMKLLHNVNFAGSIWCPQNKNKHQIVLNSYNADKDKHKYGSGITA